jgi:hypothetical protein
MRWTVLVGLSAVCFGVGFGVGFSLRARPTVVAVSATPLAPEMSVSRFLTCSSAQPDIDMDALWLRWRLRYWRPDWPAP